MEDELDCMIAGDAPAANGLAQTAGGNQLQLGQIFDALPVAVYATEAQGRLTYFNRAAVQLFGHAPELGTDKWWAAWRIFRPDGSLISPDEGPLAATLHGSEVKAGQEFIAERPDGGRFWFLLYRAAVRDRQGRVTGGLNILVDITNRKAAERETEHQFRAIFETTPECVKIIARGGTLLHMNPSGLAMLGASCSGDVIGQSVFGLIAPEDRDRFREFNDRVCAGEKGSMEFDMVGFASERRHMETHAAPLTRADGTTAQLAVTRDITERKRTQRAALLLSAIVDSSDDAIISKDLNGVITSWNKSAERLFGYTAEEAIGQAVATILIPADRQDEEPEILARLRRGDRVDHFHTVRKRKDGGLLDISLTISPVKDRSGRIIGASKIARDITELVKNQEALRKLNESLKQSNADLEQFAYSASHDLQEPLRMVQAYSGMLRKKFAGKLGANGDEYIRYILEGADRLERLLRDLRAFTQASTANDGPPPEADANAVLEQSLATLKVAIDESGAEISVGPLPSVCIHPLQLGQLFQNIIGNAMAYRGTARPRIRVGAERNGDNWTFSVQDNGIGIAPQYKEQIFGIFKRLHTTSEYPGTGMGLAICQRIVERCGGRIWVESEPGRGSTFFFSLPAARTP